jgi:hypothetical protein
MITADQIGSWIRELRAQKAAKIPNAVAAAKGIPAIPSMRYLFVKFLA